MLDRLVSRIMVRSLRNAFRRICWVGPPPRLDPARPVVVYANHHTFYDGYVLWLMSTKMLGRLPMTWMADWDAFPFFSTVGALPFPPNEPMRRLKTIRGTARRMETDPTALLFYFPEGVLHPPEEGVRPFSSEEMARLDRILPDKQWWPVAIHFTTRGESLPTLMLAGGEPHDAIDGGEKDRLTACLDGLRAPGTVCTTVLLEGAAGPEEGASFRWTRRWFERYLP